MEGQARRANGVETSNQPCQEPRSNPTIQAMIRRTKTGFKVTSKTHNKNLGTFPTKAQAENRLRQVEYFKHLKKTGRK